MSTHSSPQQITDEKLKEILRRELERYRKDGDDAYDDLTYARALAKAAAIEDLIEILDYEGIS